MSAQVEDLEFISQKMLDAIIRDEQLGEAAAQKENNRKVRNRLRCYIHDNRIPDPVLAGGADPEGRACCPSAPPPSDLSPLPSGV